MEHCVFCAIVAGRAPARVVREDERTLAFLDINPLTRGHALVVPKAHADDLLDVAVEDLEAVARGAQAVARRAKERLGADGVNLIQATGAAAFQTVFHLHVHVLPRYAGDGIAFPFVRAPGRPGDLDELAALLAAE